MAAANSSPVIPRSNTLLVERAVSLGTTKDTKATQHRTVRLLQPLRTDLLSFMLASGHPGPHGLVFPGHDGRKWTEPAYQPWRRRSFDAARDQARRHEGHAVLPAPRCCCTRDAQSSPSRGSSDTAPARLILTRYGHVIDELEDSPVFPASANPAAANDPETTEPPREQGFPEARWS